MKLHEMSLSDSMFSFDVVVKTVESCELDCKDFKVAGRFADWFELNIYPGNFMVSKKPTQQSKEIRKATTRRLKFLKFDESRKKEVHQCVRSILIIINVHSIISKVIKYIFEILLWIKTYTDYLNNLNRKKVATVVKVVYNVFDEATLKSVAIITIRIILKALDYGMISLFMCFLEFESKALFYSFMNSKPIRVLSEIKIYDNQSNNKQNQQLNIVKTKVIGKKYLLNIASIDNSENQRDSVLIDNNKQVELKTSIYVSNLDIKGKYNAFDYIFGDPDFFPNVNKVYFVYYFTVDVKKSGTSYDTSKTSLGTNPSKSSDKIINNNKQNNRIRLQKCRSECSNKNDTYKISGSCRSDFFLNLPQEVDLISVGKCDDVRCESKVHRKLPDPPDDALLLNLNNLNNKCCEELAEKIEEIIGSVSADMKIGENPCFCTCECRFGFTKKTTYCGVCGGYEIGGDELLRKRGHEMPYPCPIFHKLVDKNKLKTLSTSGSESKKKDDKNLKTGSSQKAGASDKRLIDKKSIESDKDAKKSKKNKKDDRFKFNYGYKAPQIGHSKCALPFTGTLRNVPKHMGWLWTAEDIPGLKFRPLWKPGASNKHVVRLLKIAKNPEESFAKKRRRDAGKKKRPLKRPLLIVHKKDGEFTVTMETMKTFTKPRAINQHPYEDKPVITYTIGRTEEENRDRRKKKERVQRRLERAQRHFIQDTFKDVCKEICLKTYQQALGILPEAEDPNCTCYPALPTAEQINFNVSCSCSEDSESIGSDTDSDEWFIEFTPPNALFDPTFKGKKMLKVDNSTQYTYLDYRVKLVDRFGNPVPRFFKGPDRKQQCSDLGGFWSPDHKWLEINVDGFIAPDGKWAPNIFIGPSGEQVDAESGKFQVNNGKWLVVGIDGYIDSQGKWRFYPKRRGDTFQSKPLQSINSKKAGTNRKRNIVRSDASWSCFGDISPRQLSKLGIVGHGQDKKMLGAILKDMLARGEDVRIPKSSTVQNQKAKKSTKPLAVRNTFNNMELTKCRHPVPSSKGIIAVDNEGNKTYFKLKDYKNKRPQQRLAALSSQGISLSSFHVPCVHSFINCEIMKRQQRERLIGLANKNIATQI